MHENVATILYSHNDMHCTFSRFSISPMPDPSVPYITNRRRRQSFVIPISCVIAIFALFLNYWYSSVHLQLEPYNYRPPLPASLEQYKNHLHDVYRRYAYSIHMKPSDVIVLNRPEQPLNLVLVHRPKK